MLLKDFLVAQTAGAVAVSWMDNNADAASTPRLDGVEVRHHTAVGPDTDALPVILVRRVQPDHVLGRLERRRESTRLVVLTDLFLLEPAVEKLVAAFAAAGCQLLHAVEIDDATELDVFSAFALQRRWTPPHTTGPSTPDLATAGLETLRRSIQDGEHGSVDRLRRLTKDRDQARRDLRRPTRNCASSGHPPRCRSGGPPSTRFGSPGRAFLAFRSDCSPPGDRVRRCAQPTAGPAGPPVQRRARRFRCPSSRSPCPCRRSPARVELYGN